MKKVIRLVVLAMCILFSSPILVAAEDESAAKSNGWKPKDIASY